MQAGNTYSVDDIGEVSMSWKSIQTLPFVIFLLVSYCTHVGNMIPIADIISVMDHHIRLNNVLAFDDLLLSLSRSQNVLWILHGKNIMTFLFIG